jgi:hypothetical protein
MSIVNLFGVGVKGRSTPVVGQRRINLVAEPAKAADKSQFTLYGRPGTGSALVPVTTGGGGTTIGVGPVTGVCVMAYKDLAAGTGVTPQDYINLSQEGLWQSWGSQVERTVAVTSGGDPNPGTGLMSIAYNGTRGFAVNGSVSYGLVPYQPATNSMMDSVTFPWNGATVVVFIAGRYVVNYPGQPGQFCWSALYWTLFTPWNGLDYATAESSPDALVSLSVYRGQLLLWGTSTLEFWATDPNVVFSNVRGTTLNWGLQAQWSVQEVAGSMYFLGIQPNGRPQVCKLTGYQVEVVSTPDVEFDIFNDANIYALPNQTMSTCFTVAGHSYYILHLTQTSWVYDATTGIWCEWQTQNANGTMGRWMGQFVFEAWGRLFVTDYRNANIYLLDDQSYTENGQPIVRELWTRHAFNNLDRMSVAELVLEMETGTGISTGQGSDPKVMLYVSRDGGRTFGNELSTSIGKLGEYLTRIVWRRLGRARDFLFRFRISDPIKSVFINIAMRIDP